MIKKDLKKRYLSRIIFHKNEIKRYKKMIKTIDKEKKKSYNNNIKEK